MDLDLSVVTLKSTPFDLQLFCVPNDICSPEEIGKYATVLLDDSSSYLCRVFREENLQKKCCLIDKIVQCTPRHVVSECPKVSNVKFIPNLKVFKTVKLVVVLRHVEDANIWKNKRISYLSLVKQLLRLFVISTGSTLNLDNFDAAKKLGIKSMLVRDAGTPNPGKVANSTRVILTELVSCERFSLRNSTESILALGCAKAYRQMAEFVHFRKSLSGNKLAADYRYSQLMVVGPGGCGKKTLIRKVALESDAVLVRLDCTKCTRPKPGVTEALIGRTFNHALSLAKEGLTILFLLHIETVCHKPGRIVDLMNNFLDSVARMPNLIVATSSSDPARIHESLKSGSRFNNVIHVGAPNEEERAAMLKSLAGEDLPLTDRMCQDLAQMTPGYVLADLSLIVNNARRKIFFSDCDPLPKAEVAFTELKSGLSVVEPSALRGELGVVKSGFPNTELGGLHQIKETLFRTVLWPLQHAAAFEKLNIKRSSGVLLYGPPGCAKTSLARTVAAGSNVSFLAVSAADLYSPFVGDTERTIASLFQRARAAAPTLLFIDEIDALVGNRDSGQKKAQERVLSSFLIEMDGIGAKIESECQQDPSESRVIIVAATNRPNVIDAALLRPGRLDKLIHVPPPDVHDRQDILNVVTKSMPLHENVNVLEIAEMTDLHSGADLSNLCREAAFHAMTSRGMDAATIDRQDFLTVLSKFEPSLNASMVQWYKDYRFS